MSLPIHYRYDAHAYDHGVDIVVSKWYAIRETPCFYIVISEFDFKLSKAASCWKTKDRRVSKNGVRRYCYPCKKMALQSLRARKNSQIRHCKLALSIAHQAVSKINQMDLNSDLGGDIQAGKPEGWENLVNFD